MRTSVSRAHRRQRASTEPGVSLVLGRLEQPSSLLVSSIAGSRHPSSSSPNGTPGWCCTRLRAAYDDGATTSRTGRTCSLDRGDLVFAQQQRPRDTHSWSNAIRHRSYSRAGPRATLVPLVHGVCQSVLSLLSRELSGSTRPESWRPGWRPWLLELAVVAGRERLQQVLAIVPGVTALVVHPRQAGEVAGTGGCSCSA